MKITLVQSRGIMMDPTVNFFKARMRINNVDSDIFVLPEMFCSGYTGDKKMMTLPQLEGKIVSKISELSVNRGSTIIMGCPREYDDGLYDCALVVCGKEVSEYRKMILSTDGAFDETQIFKAGDRPMIMDHMGLRLGISVGYDLLSAELFRFYAEKDVDMIICIAAMTEKQMDRFDKIVRSRSAEFSMPVIVCNMVGPDCGINLIGRSKFIGPDGNNIEACTESSDVRVITVDESILKEAKAARVITPEVVLGECIEISTESGNGENKATCPYTGAILDH
ncbi:MAG: carbon-nitrogen hydrolase family protein [Candidatus Methanomethylophilaceae archaeon]|nr:carbon-nitrogen hydrolase family protein [Candidatus Methanomethylophilaceae archaeon]